MAKQTSNAASVAVRLLRGAFLSVLVDHGVKQTLARAGRGSQGQRKARGTGSAAVQGEALRLDLQRRRVRECCIVVIFADTSFEPSAGAASDRMRVALEADTPVFIVTEEAYHGSVKR